VVYADMTALVDEGGSSETDIIENIDDRRMHAISTARHFMNPTNLLIDWRVLKHYPNSWG